MPSKSSLRTLILRGGAWTLFGRAGASVVGLGLNVLLARLLSPADLGRYYFLSSALAAAVIVATLGMSAGVFGMVGEAMGRGKAGQARGTIIRCVALAAVGAAVLATLATGINFLLPAHLLVDPLLMLVLCAWLIAASVLAMEVESLRALHHSAKANLFGGPLNNTLLCAALATLAVLAHPTGLSTAVMLSASTTGAVALLAFFAIRAACRDLGPAEPPRTGAILRTSFPLLINGLAIFFTTQSDLWIIGYFLESDQMGTYGAASRLVQLLLMPTLMANLVIAPFAARFAGEADFHTLERVARAMALLTAVPAVVVFCIFLAAAPDVMGLAYGPAYRVGAQALVLISAGQLLNVLAGPAATILMTAGEQRGVMWISAACGSGMILLGCVLVRSWGVNGVAFAVGCASAVHGIWCWTLVRRKLGISTHADLRSIFTLLKARPSIIGGPP